MPANTCPLLKKDCIEHQCRWYIQLIGTDPQTGAQMNKWGCAVEFLPVLLIENAQEVRQTAAAVESTRNENVRNVGILASALLRTTKDVNPALENKQ